jgi:hypothetical protein
MKWSVWLAAMGLAVPCLAGCGGGQAGRIAELAVQRADRAAISPWIGASERVAAQSAARDSDGLYSRVAGIVRKHVDDLEEEDAKRVVKYACEANDLFQVGPNPSKAKVEEYLKAHVPGTYGRRSRVVQLAEELRTTRSVGDVATKLAIASTCEAMS